MWSIPKTKLICHDQSNQVWSVTKTREDNNMIDHIGLVYVEIKTKLLRPIWHGAIYEEN